MKLGNKKIIISKIFLVLILMLLITSMTISYLYSYNNINKEEYLTLMLSDSYEDDMYTKIVEVIKDRLNPLNLIDIKASNINFDLNNRNIVNPEIYIYNKNQDEEYKTMYNVKSTLLLTSYYLSEELNNIGVKTIFEDDNILSFSLNNNLDNNVAIKLFVEDKKENYKSIKYFIELGRENNLNTIKYKNTKFSKVNLYANGTNISFITKLNNILNDKIPNISKIYFDDEYNNSIKINVGGKNNTMKEVLKSIKLLSSSIKEVIYE